MPTINKNKKKREYNNAGNRGERQKIYNTKQWKALSKAYLMQHPLCEECLKHNKVSTAQHVHHIISFMTAKDELSRIELALDANNLEALCVECHIQKHNKKHNNKDTNKEKENDEIEK